MIIKKIIWAKKKEKRARLILLNCTVLNAEHSSAYKTCRIGLFSRAFWQLGDRGSIAAVWADVSRCCKTGSDSSIAKRSATDVSVGGDSVHICHVSD